MNLSRITRAGTVTLGGMQSFLDLDIRAKVFDYVDGRLSFADFHDWVTPHVWNAGSLGNQLADELAGEIGLRIAEFTGGYWTEAELKSLLRPLVDEVEFAPAGELRIRANSAAQTTVRQHSAAL